MDIWYMYVVLDTRWYTWSDWTSDSITGYPYYYLFMFYMLFQSYFSIYYLHMLARYMHIYLPCYFTHSLGRFHMTLDLHVKTLDVLSIWSGVRWDCMLYEDSEFPLFGSGILVSLFIPVVFIVFLILYISHSLPVLFLLFICDHLWILYELLQWYWFIVVDFL